ncbi:MAG: 2-oxoacid:acceptor oxidoreductase subunit alpha, partial [Chloroflexi bacterium]|nr:2-oxoacid:acceptor oxidoreductase subunit alpha [Chloroflexota bacterium]
DYARERYAADFPWKLEPIPGPQRMLINGNHAFSLGAVAGGCRFISGYPMTPATSILEWMVAHADQFGIVTKQTEDEISACLMAIGANHAGVRAMTATSGGGFCLMVEALGLAGCTETPLVIVLAQRGGPSTGLPTRTEQSDLEFVLRASHGEFPRIIIAPGTVEQCFQAGARAFNLAEKYQTPVIVITDLFLATQLRAVDQEAFDFGSVVVDRGATLTPEQIEAWSGNYNRYELTESGVSPRALPGSAKGVYVAGSDEHTLDGHITEDAQVRNEQMRKRMRKLDTIADEMNLPTCYGPEDAEITLIGWGSTCGSMIEAMKVLNEAERLGRGGRVNVLHFVDLWPLRWDEVEAMLRRIRVPVVVEQNYTGQLANVLQCYTAVRLPLRINKYDGRPVSPDEIVAVLEKEVMVRV